MAVPNRAAKFVKLHKVAKKHFPPVSPPTHRTLLENMLYACCLENAKFDAADEAFARLQQDYFDWNEIRVTTTQELSEVMSCLPEPIDAAARLKRTLHSMFEIHYSFDIEALKKESLGNATQHLGKYNGITPFVISYTTQVSLGGHSIAIDKATAALLVTLDLIGEKDAQAFQAPGLERAIPKNKGGEFFSVVHQLAASLFASPHNPSIRSIVMDIDPEAKSRLPKRGGRKRAKQAEQTREASRAPKKIPQKSERKKRLRPRKKRKPPATSQPPDNAPANAERNPRQKNTANRRLPPGNYPEKSLAKYFALIGSVLWPDIHTPPTSNIAKLPSTKNGPNSGANSPRPSSSPRSWGEATR